MSDLSEKTERFKKATKDLKENDKVDHVIQGGDLVGALGGAKDGEIEYLKVILSDFHSDYVRSTLDKYNLEIRDAFCGKSENLHLKVEAKEVDQDAE